QILLLNGVPFTIVGVAPANFHGVLSGRSPELFVPISMKAALEPGWNSYDRPNSQWLNLIGRLAPGVSRDTAAAQLQPLFAAVIRDHVKQIGVHSKSAERRLLAKRVELRPASQGLNELERQWRQPLFVLLGMVGLLLLIGCANLANLLMARSVNRSREFSIRLALGAERWRVVRLLLAESVVVACSGSMAGLLLTPVLTRGLLRLMPQSAVGGWLTSGLNLPLLGFCAFLMLAATLLFGLLPAVHVTRRGSAALAERTQTSAGGAIHGKSRKLLVTGQLALSLVLLAVAGLFGRSLGNLMTRSPGFHTARLLVFNVDPGLGGYSVDRGLEFYRELIHRLSNLPGVASASLSEFGILAHSEATTNVSVEGFRPSAEEDAMCDMNAIGAGFFRTLGTPLLDGREFGQRDQVPGAPKAAIVNQAFVRRFLYG
ncbi:MAG: FtsX-like permease family protein, partial [Bryobacteraceae bacterium]